MLSGVANNNNIYFINSRKLKETEMKHYICLRPTTPLWNNIPWLFSPSLNLFYFYLFMYLFLYFCWVKANPVSMCQFHFITVLKYEFAILFKTVIFCFSYLSVVAILSMFEQVRAQRDNSSCSDCACKCSKGSLFLWTILLKLHDDKPAVSQTPVASSHSLCWCFRSKS